MGNSPPLASEILDDDKVSYWKKKLNLEDSGMLY
jgi:hypothetical protein